MSTTNTTVVQQFGKIWPRCVARAWQDPAFREALKKDPVGTIQSSYQFAFPQGFKLEITEAHETQAAAPEGALRMVIPPPPTGDVGQIAVTDVANGLNHHGPRSPRLLSLSFTS